MARITLLGPDWPYRGGIAHFQASTRRALAARGHAVDAVTFCRQYPEALFPGTTQYDPGPPPGRAAPRVLDTLNPLSWRRTARHVVEGGAEVLVLMYWMGFFAPALGVVARRVRRRGVRVVAVVHNALSHEGRPGEAALARFALGACDGLVVLSEAVRDDLRRVGVDAPIHVTPHPTVEAFGEPLPQGEARAALSLPAHGPLFLFFGFIRRYKGLHVLLEAMRSVRSRVPEARLVVAGEFYADEEALRAQVAALGDAVRLDAEYIPDDRVGLYVSAADAVVQPYLSATQSGVAQVAFHFGRPVITTDVGGLAETVPDGEAGLVVPPDDPDALADALVRFVRDDLGLALTAGAERQRERYSWGRLAEAVEEAAGLALAQKRDPDA